MAALAVAGYRREGRRRAALGRARRFALVTAIVATAGLVLGTAVTFTAQDASATVPISPSTAAGGVTIRGNALPGGINAPTTCVSGSVGTGAAPVWSPALNSAVAVTTAGDIAVVDTRGLGTANVLITFTLTNAAALDGSHNYFTLPVDLKVWDHATATWMPASSGNGNGDGLHGGTTYATQYLSLTNGFLTFTVDADEVYEIAIPTGGSIYAVNTASLSPTFFVSATPA